MQAEIISQHLKYYNTRKFYQAELIFYFILITFQKFPGNNA